MFELAPLRLEDAVELFALRSARPGDPDEVREVCRSLDGLPLAIELAAARTRTLSVEEIARRLDDRFTVLSDPASRKPERRRALRATIGWSYDLLFPDDQRGLWALATFPGGASLAAAESVLGALDVPAEAAIDVVEPAREPLAGDRGRAAPLPAARQHPRVRARGAGRGGAHSARLRCACRLVRGAGRLVDGGRAQRAAGRAPRVRAHRARQHRRRAGLVRGPRPRARARAGQRVRLGVDRPRRRPRRTAPARRARRRRRRGPGARAGDRAPARRLDRGVLGRPRACPPAHRRRDRARGRRPRPGGPLRLLPRLRRVT